MLMMLFFVIVFFMFLCLLGYPYEIMEHIKKYWRELTIGILILIITILSIWISAINKSNPEAEFKIKQYDILIKEKDSIANESIKYQKLLAEKGRQYEDSVEYYKNQIGKGIIYIHDIKNQKDEEVNSIITLTMDSVNKLFDREAEDYIRSK